MRSVANIVLFLFFLNCVAFGQLFQIENTIDTLFIGETITFKNTSSANKLSLYYSLDSGRTWSFITDSLIDEFKWQIPFTLKTNIKFKANKESITPPQLIWDEPFAHNGEIRSASFSDDGKFILTLSSDSYIKVWDIAKRQCVDSLKLNTLSYSYDAKFFHSNDKIIFAEQNVNYIWNRTNKTRSLFYTIGDFIRKIDVHPTDNQFAVISNDNNMAIFRATFLLPIPINLRLYSNSDYGNSYSIRYSPLGDELAIATYTGKIITSTGTISSEKVYKVDSSPVYAISYLSNKSYISFGGASNTLKFLNTTNNNITNLEPSFQSSIREIKFNQIRNDLIAASLDSTLNIWNNNVFVSQIKEPYALLSCDFTKTGDSLLTAGRNNGFRVWKNYQFNEESQVLDFTCLQKVYFSFNLLKTNFLPGELFNLKIQVQSNYKDTLSKLGAWNIITKLQLPASLIDIIDTNKSLFDFQTQKIILTINKMYNFANEDFAFLKLKTLYCNINIGPIEFANIEIIPKDNFYPILQSKIIEVDYPCQKADKPNIEFVQQNDFNTQIIENNSNNLEIGIKIECNLSLNMQFCDINGNILRTISTTNFEKGYYERTINIKDFPVGTYFLIVSSGNSKQIRKFQIFR
jgi:WD40 repeat protein